MTLDLAALGWNARFDEQFEPYRQAGLMAARVSLEHTHIYRVLSEQGESLARVAGRLRHNAERRADFPAVGDWVAIEPDAHGGDARIRAVLPRFSRFSRRAAGDWEDAVFSRHRSTSATLHAWATQPRGVYGASASKISLTDPTQAASR